jgi:uncharacterized protein (DUF2164 family)
MLKGRYWMRDNNKIELTKEKKKEMVEAIKYYFLKEREEEIGDLASGLILEFIIEKLAPEFYNQGVYDSYKYMELKIEDILAIQKIV